MVTWKVAESTCIFCQPKILLYTPLIYSPTSFLLYYSKKSSHCQGVLKENVNLKEKEGNKTPLCNHLFCFLPFGRVS
nr:MAG TPA: hypothetical protein [Caudoviricetes sp.]DAT69768.1 MAG TPA: hypothetical protein [Caudoviricetes sp.]